VYVQYQRGPLAARAGVRIEAAAGQAGQAGQAGATSLRALNAQGVREAVAAHHGNIAAAARQLGISRTTLYRHLRG
jgi:transcriptional regulator of acetoin/glycerol metabolism